MFCRIPDAQDHWVERSTLTAHGKAAHGNTFPKPGPMRNRAIGR